jgi:hypothetical protein
MVHLIKLCVGVANVEELIEWRAERRSQGFGRPDGLNSHRTRMMPKRRGEIIGQGSLYWVIAGVTRCRQRIVGLEPVTDSEGRNYCNILMDPEIIYTAPYPRRPFQGWRYLEDNEAPSDLEGETDAGERELAGELARLGLI